MAIRSKVIIGLVWLGLHGLPGVSQAWWCAEDWSCDNRCDWNYDLTGNVQLSGGYRLDEMAATVNSFAAPGLFTDQNKLKAKNIQIWEVGAKGSVALGNFYIRGFGYTGWGNQGRYREAVTDGNDATIFSSRAHIDHVRTQDALVGLGYMFTSCVDSDSVWGIAPIAGWSYAHQRLKLKHGESNGVEDLAYDGLVYKNRWSGPWLGFDVSYKKSNFVVNAGYEYHWSSWHAEWLLDEADVLPTAFSDRRRSNQAHGNVIYADGYWQFACRWELGIGLKWQEWNVRHGHLKPVASFAEAGLPETAINRVKQAKWRSGEITLNLGYLF